MGRMGRQKIMNLQEVIDNATTAYNAIERLHTDTDVTETILIAGDYPEITLEALSDALSALRTINNLFLKILALDEKDSQ